MGNDARGHKGSRSGQRDGSSGDVTPRQATIGEVEKYRIARVFLLSTHDKGKRLGFIKDWMQLNRADQEAVALAIAESFLRDAKRFTREEMWEEAQVLLKIWSKRLWDKTPEALDELLGWVATQQKELGLDLAPCDAPPAISAAA